MPAPGTQFAGPLISGPQQYPVNGTPANVGYAILTQTAVLTQNSTNAVSATFSIPANSQILDFLIDNLIVWDSASSAGLTIGTTAAGTQYMSALSLLTGGAGVGRTTFPGPSAGTPTPLVAQLTAMGDIGTNTSVVATVTVSGATTTGTTRVTIRYVQTVDWMI